MARPWLACFRARERKQELAAELQRRILVGALVVGQWPGGVAPEDWRRALDQHLTREHDRRLFGLASNRP